VSLGNGCAQAIDRKEASPTINELNPALLRNMVLVEGTASLQTVYKNSINTEGKVSKASIWFMHKRMLLSIRSCRMYWCEKSLQPQKI